MDAIERVIRRAYELGALAASDAAAPLYRGARLASIGRARPTQSRRRAASARRRTTTASTCSSSSLPLDRSGEIACDWRDGDVW